MERAENSPSSFQETEDVMGEVGSQAVSSVNKM
jgi:hypothetical protein